MICQLVVHFSYSLFIYYLKITWKNTHKPYIFTIFYCLHVSSVKTFLIFIQLSYSDSRVSLSICTQKCLRESVLWLPVWIKHALHESVQLSWYSYLLILYTNKTSGHVSFNFKSRNLYVKTPAWAWIKCRGRIYIKLILNIKNAANVVLHTAIKTKVLVLFRSCCLIGKSLKRVEVPCLFMLSD